MIHYLLLAAGIALGVAGQFLLKAGADADGIVEQFLRLPTLVVSAGMSAEDVLKLVK